MTVVDENDRHVLGSLPSDAFSDAEPYEIAPASQSRRAARTITLVDATQMAKPLPPVPYLVPDLGIASGAPVLVAGYGFSGKTVSLQSVALSVASGLPAWGIYSARRGRALHLDFEQGSRVTYERYQRLARGLGIDFRALGKALQLAVNPEVYLDDRDALDVYKRLFEGFDFVVLDSLRAAAIRADENASEIRRYIDLVSRAAEPHGAVVALVHHARKPTADSAEGGRYRIRGSSALFDACGSVFVFSAEKNEPTRVAHEKCRNRGTLVDDFGIKVEDVEVDGDPRAGLRVVHLGGEQLGSVRGATPSGHADGVDRVASFLRTTGEFRGTKSGLCQELRIGRDRFFAALSELESCGDAKVGRDESGPFVRWVGAAESAMCPDGSGQVGTRSSPVPSRSLGGRTGRP